MVVVDVMLTSFYVLAFAAMLSKMIYDKWCLTWDYHLPDKAGDIALTSILPAIGLVAICAAACGLNAADVSVVARVIANALSLVCSIASIVLTGICTIKKYHDAGHEANVAAFIHVCIYAVVLFAGSVFFSFFVG